MSDYLYTHPYHYHPKSLLCCEACRPPYFAGGPPGEDSTCFKINEAESTDRTNLTLPGYQMPLFRAMLALGEMNLLLICLFVYLSSLPLLQHTVL